MLIVKFLICRYGGRPITTVKAEDADSPGPQSEVRYRIIGDGIGSAARLFRIDELSGGIYPLEMFDREKNDSFIFDVEARDSMDSSLPGATGPNRGTMILCLMLMVLNDLDLNDDLVFYILIDSFRNHFDFPFRYC